MSRYSYQRRQAESPRWRLNDPNGEPIALVETENGASDLVDKLNQIGLLEKQLRELRVLLAVAGKTLEACQACAILNCTPQQLDHKIATCLKEEFQ